MGALAPGANQALPGAGRLSVTVRTERAHADLIALCVDGAGRADGDNGVALWSQPECAAGAVRIDVPADTVWVEPGRLPETVAKILVVAQADGVADLGACGALSAEVGADGAPAAALSVPEPPPMPTVRVAELYRHGGGWKVRCLGDGYRDGLQRLLEVHGIEVSDEPPPTPPAPAAPAGPAVRFTKGEDQLPVDMRKALSLRKEKVAGVLLEKGVPELRARVLLVLDCSGSMRGLYTRGVMAAAVERVIAVAAQLDDDGEMEAWRFATECAQVPTLRLAELPYWIPHCVLLDRQLPDVQPGPLPPIQRVGTTNEEHKVIAAVRAFVDANPAADPTFVLFFTDGGVNRDRDIERELRAAMPQPIFWQFIGLGAKRGYGILERFDTLPGREIDNVGFFAVDDIATIPDDELYRRLLSEFPQWIEAARGLGILR